MKTEGIKKYFDRSQMSKPAPPTLKENSPTIPAESEVNDITQQASALDISSNPGQVKGHRRAGQAPTSPPASHISAIPGHIRSEGVSSDEGSGVRRSPRIAKRARSVVDEVNKKCSTQLSWWLCTVVNFTSAKLKL